MQTRVSKSNKSKQQAPIKLNKPKDSTRDSLIRAAIRTFAKKGYEGATVHEICAEAGVNISLVSYHFKGKEGLYKSCLEKFALSRLNIARSALKPADSIEEFKFRLSQWVEQNLETSVKEKDLMTIIHRDFSFDSSCGKEVFHTHFMEIFSTLHLFFEKAKRNKLLKPDVDTLIGATLFHGGLIHLCRYDKIGKKIFKRTIEKEKYRQLVAKQAVENIVSGMIAYKKEST